jgi:hypothetical protein
MKHTLVFISKKTTPVVVGLLTVLSLVASPGLYIGNALAATGGPNFAGTGVNGGGTGAAWSSTTAVTADDDLDATVSGTGTAFSQALNSTNFSFSIPTTATINGIQVVIGRHRSGNGNGDIRDNSVQLIKAGSTVGDNKAATSTNWPSNERTANYGSTSDLWGTAWTPADVNASNFGVALVVSNTSTSNPRTANVDYVRVTVTYTEAAVINPSIGQSCGLDIALVLDSSVTIDSTELGQMKTAFTGFVDAFLPETPTMFSVTEFDTTAEVVKTFTDNQTEINSAIDSVTTGMYTNWQDGLVKAYGTFDPRLNKANLIVFASDGEPNRYGSNPVQGSGSNFNQASLDAAVAEANSIKAGGTRIITLGIGVTGSNADNLRAISGVGAYYDVSSFADLKTTLAQLASDLCGGTINITKIIDQDGDLNTVDDQTPGVNWGFDVRPGSPGQITDSGGHVSVPVDAGMYNVSETVESGYTLIDSSCTGQTSGTVSNLVVSDEDTVFCTFYNQAPEMCQYDPDILASDPLCVAPAPEMCQYNDSILASDPACVAPASPGTIIIEKHIGANDSSRTFLFDVSWIGEGQGNPSPDGPYDLGVEANSSAQSGNLDAGTYWIIERVPSGWTPTSIVCDDQTGETSTNVETRTASIDLAAGETVTCTFTNTQESGGGPTPVDGYWTWGECSAQCDGGTRTQVCVPPVGTGAACSGDPQSESCNTQSCDNEEPTQACGNNTVEGTEQCDGTNLNDQTCESRGFDGGALSCSACSFDTSGCETDVHRSSGGHTHAGSGTVAGESTGEVLGEQTEIVPAGAPNTGFGEPASGTRTVTFETLQMFLKRLGIEFIEE